MRVVIKFQYSDAAAWVRKNNIKIMLYFFWQLEAIRRADRYANRPQITHIGDRGAQASANFFGGLKS